LLFHYFTPFQDRVNFLTNLVLFILKNAVLHNLILTHFLPLVKNLVKPYLLITLFPNYPLHISRYPLHVTRYTLPVTKD